MKSANQFTVALLRNNRRHLLCSARSCWARRMEPSDASPDLVVEDRFAIVPEWLLDAEVSDAAVRLYAVLLRYGQSSGARMPSRSSLARRLHKKSTDSVDRAMKDLVGIGAVVVEHRYDGGQRLTNAYHVRTSRPGRSQPPTPTDGGSRRPAATRKKATRGSRTDAAGVAADSGHDPEHLTQSTPTSSGEAPRRGPSRAVSEQEVAGACAIDDWPSFVTQVQRTRRDLGASVTRWAGPCLAAALQLAIRGRGWPAAQAAAALRRVAIDPETRSPMRVAEAGPWWDESPTTPEATDDATETDGVDLRAMELALLEAGGVRIELQTRARRTLEEAGVPVTRNAVIRGAYRLLADHDATTADGSSGGAA
jgi:hypothetical protein